MITVRGRELVIPVDDRVIGTDIDNNSEVRFFQLERVPGGIDISHLEFHVDLMYEGTIYDTCKLDAEIQDDKIVLQWLITKNNVAYPGTMWIAIRGKDDAGTVKWSTNRAACYVLDTVNTPGNFSGLSDLERYESLINQALAKCDEVMDTSSDKVNECISEANQTLNTAQSALEQASDALMGATTAAEESKQSAGNADRSADLAEAWAHGKAGYPENDDDNSKYWSYVSKKQAERAQSEADRASMYADFVTPKFLIHNNRLYLKNDSTAEFLVSDNRLYIKLPA